MEIPYFARKKTVYFEVDRVTGVVEFEEILEKAHDDLLDLWETEL
jgi:hypothetical protein